MLRASEWRVTVSHYLPTTGQETRVSDTRTDAEASVVEMQTARRSMAIPLDARPLC